MVDITTMLCMTPSEGLPGAALLRGAAADALGDGGPLAAVALVQRGQRNILPGAQEQQPLSHTYRAQHLEIAACAMVGASSDILNCRAQDSTACGSLRAQAILPVAA